MRILKRTVRRNLPCRLFLMWWCQPGCCEGTSALPCLLLLFSRCSLRRLFSSLLACPRLHFLILHFFLWMVSEQGSPPNCGSSVTVRVRMVWPFPHDLLHSDHSVQSDMTQSMAEERPEGGDFREERMTANAAPKIKGKGQEGQLRLVWLLQQMRSHNSNFRQTDDITRGVLLQLLANIWASLLHRQ